MPKILERLKSQLMPRLHSESKAYAEATAILQRAGILKKGTTQLTPKGKKRDAMTPAQRAKDRASKASGRKHKPSEYTYNKNTNRASLH